MCNLYSITRSQEAMRRLFRAKRDLTGNFPGLTDVFPDVMAPVVHTAPDGERELSLMRWGFPPVPNLGKVPVTNVRNLKSPYWRGWLKAEWRCWHRREDAVGTLHTVQGREADSVILVLGAPLPGQHGARSWAGARPNLLNVAATRVKENLYVVGSRALWQDVGYFRQLALRMP